MSLGRLGKNRNVVAPTLLSAMSAALSVLAPWWIFLLFLQERADTLHPFQATTKTMHLIYIATAILGALLAAGMAGYYAVNHVHDAKFCEGWDCFMKEQKAARLPLRTLRAILQALSQQRIPTAAALLSSSPGEDGEVILFHCLACGRGYVEVMVHFKATWKEKNKAKTRRARLLASEQRRADG